MKRSVVLCLLIVFLLFASVLVCAQDAADNPASLDNQAKETLTQTATDAGGNLKGIGTNLKGSLNDRTEDLLAREVSLPGWLEVPAKVLFGVEPGITWQKLIVLLGVWIMILIILIEIISFVPFLENKIISFFVALIITCLISITGAANKIALFFWDWSDFFSWLKDNTVLKIIITLISFVLLILIAFKFRKMIKKKMVIGKAEGLGMKAGAQMEIEAEKFERGGGI